MLRTSGEEENMEKDIYKKQIEDLTEEELDAIRADIEAADPELDASGITREDLETLGLIIQAALNLFIDAQAEKAAAEGQGAPEKSLKEYIDTKGDGRTITDLLENPKIRRILEAIRKATAENDKKELAPANGTAPAIRADHVDFPLDKINNRIWQLLAEETTGQIVFDLAGPAKKGTPAKAPAFYSINFDELDKDEALRGIVHRLTPTDKRIYIAIAGLYAAGNASMTYTQIYYATGRRGKPGVHDLEIIENSTRKMTHAFITLNDEKAAAALGRQSYPIESPLLPAILAPLTDESRKLRNEERGRVAPLCEPPLITYARRYKQITTLPLKLLQGPISKTDAGIALEDYLLDTIAHAKRAHKQTEVRTYDTIAERIRQTARKQRERLPEKVLRLLDYYKQCEHIKDYNKRPDGVEIIL